MRGPWGARPGIVVDAMPNHLPPPAPAGLPIARRRPAGRRPAGFVQAPSVTSCDDLVTDDTEGHLLTIAPTGAGKGVSAVMPWLLSHPGSLVVVDPKGEAASITASERQRRGQRVCVLDPFGIARLPAGILSLDQLNPLEVALCDSDEISDDCVSLAELIAGEPPGSLQEPFWRQSALDLEAALIGWAWLRARVTGSTAADDGTLSAVWNLLHADDLPMAMAVVLDRYGNHPDLPPFVRNGFVNFLHHEGDKVRTSVRSEAVSLMRVFGSHRIQQIGARTTLPLDTLRDGGPVTVYLVIPPNRLESHAQWLRVILGSLLQLMVRRRERPEVPTLFVVDELGHLGPMPQLKQAVTLLRGYGVRLALFLQSIAQLKGLWPKDYEAMLENCGVWLNFGNATMAAARHVADQLGDVGAEALYAMAADELAVHRPGRATEIMRRLDYRIDPLFQGRFDPNPYFAKRGRQTP